MIRKISASGTPYQVGKIIGKKTKTQIHRQLRSRKKTIPLDKRKEFQKKLQGYLKQAQKFPDYLAELKGLAEGSQTSFRELLKFNLMEFWFLEKEKCTSIVYQNKKDLCLFHNEDAALTRDVFLAEINYQNQVKILSLCYYGILPGISVTLNNFGLSLSLNSLYSNDWQIGLPLVFLFRRLIESKTIQEAVDFLKKTKRARSENFILIQNNRFVNLETSATNLNISSPKLPFCHTNHYLSPSMKKYENTPYLLQSQIRHQFCQKKIKNQNLTFSKTKKILSSHQNHPHAVCRHGEDNRSKTFASIHVNPSKKEMLIAHKNPCQSKFYKFKLL